MITGDYINLLALQLRVTTGEDSVIENLNSVSGGSINEAYCFNYAGLRFFMKVNSSKEFPEMFKREIEGLHELDKVKELNVPKPVFDFEYAGKQFLILNYLEKTSDSLEFFEKLGVCTAKLHKIKSGKFGFTSNNYIGSLQQINTTAERWEDFFYLYRLEPLVKWCYDERLISKTNIRQSESLYAKLPEIFPDEKPSLLHGDLWSGNKMNTTNGPAIFDPAVYYGHREMDVAMTRLFGGFDEQFYSAYENEYPLEKDYRKRTDICNLYPLLVHVRLFGSGYLHDVLNTLKVF